ncbi:lipid A export permease/ATP-binding protein MsbA [Shewanella sp. SR43-4]|jgi:subfamily B ATP-binding cassette protein MsbA|uniref:Lipid A export permease/ATP-binding protein MsbA n=1 Tax=Shewanella vesiculosa TaxID=518738 RepID=A0ABV0FLS6_9GAMM|nr:MULTISPECIES: lipid A export permease/ATP-binding protein MsbA [Shewanella]NCQ43558.1 lipid A export permease/ATP-binding protein MsbA [Shewanella frigidimarina]MBB1316489.1 lipid A export permease/ATP-binding protein MsbA [Shewanella sp. SR43-4]MBB1320747.1 lipid A export permease/ATP-binding protein MsbA [Shewanella sp. SR43-8]MBB1390026.1 lipid A export permease/ATP-binding protein MsbA [Shewanella sp. SG44-6]MBB1477240.1 lipid A export permease/ATP-binding protein MsbA [Shewanella sp. S|tara:strand:- start:854 stop:2656 length:1803 start_codon:yes stop_codon:yes gene_type:complete
MSASPKNEMWIVFKRLMTYVVPMKAMFIMAVLGLITYGAVDAAFIAFIKPFIDEGFSQTPAIVAGVDLPTHGGFNANKDIMLMAPIAVILMFSLRGLANFVSTYCVSFMSAQLIMDMRQQVFEHYLRLPVSYIDRENSGNLISRVTFDTEQIARASGSALISIVRDSMTAIGMLGIMFYYSWKLSLCILVIGPIMGVVISIVSKRFRKVSKQIQSAMGGVTATTEQMIKGHKNVLVFGGQKTEVDRFYQVNDQNRYQNMKLAVAQSVSQPLIMVIGSFALAFVLYAATWDSMKTDLTAGTFAAILGAMLAMLQPIKNLTRVNAEFQRGIAACTTVFELLDTPPEPDNGPFTIDRVQGKLTFENVTFSYPGQDKPALNGIDFEVKPGKTIALVGRSGSGKSTIASLITRFYGGLSSGDIRLDDTSIYDYQLKSLRNQVALVSQQVTLFNDTIANNIAYAYPGEVTREQIVRAAELAYAMEFIETLPKGLDTQVGENGVLLSGGQRQRIAIARAMLRDAPVLILDEATSALDTESEKAIQKGLDNLRHNRTSIVIAHRLSTIESADEILVIDQGRVVERGNHSELIAQAGIYANLYQMQFSQ